MPRLSVMGHPVPQILQAIPAAVLPASTAFDALAYLSGSESLSEAGRYSLIFGLVGGVAAAATGLLEGAPTQARVFPGQILLVDLTRGMLPYRFLIRSRSQR
jgi:uncharacterized membrane protein